MPGAADYLAIWDTDLTLEHGTPARRLPFALPADLAQGERAVLGFVVSGENAAELEVRVNGARRGPLYPLAPGQRTALWEVLSAGTLIGAGANDVEFELVPGGGGGPLVVSDVVLWFKRSVS